MKQTQHKLLKSKTSLPGNINNQKSRNGNGSTLALTNDLIEEEIQDDVLSQNQKGENSKVGGLI